MPVICFGPVCIPLHLLLPFLLGIAHQYGYLTWFKREWVTIRWWKQQWNRRFGKERVPAATAAAPVEDPAESTLASASEPPGSGSSRATPGKPAAAVDGNDCGDGAVEDEPGTPTRVRLRRKA